LNKQEIDKWLDKIADASPYQKIAVLQSAPEEALEAMFKKMEKDTSYFALVCMKHIHHYIPKHHKEAFKAFDNDNYKAIRQVWYRSSGKTTCKRTAIIKRICFQQKRHIILISETSRQAQKCTRTIKTEFEQNDIIKYIFGNLKGSSPWGVEHLCFANGVNLVPYGTRDAIRGANEGGDRIDDMWLDDFEGEKNSDTAGKRDDLLNWLMFVVKPCGVPNGYTLNLLGTIVDREAILAKQDPYVKDDKGMYTVDAMNSWFRPEFGGFSTEFAISEKVYDGSTDDINPTWKELHDLEFIKSNYRDYAAVGKLSGFYQEFYNIPATESNPVINVDMIKRVEAKFKTLGKLTYLQYPDLRRTACRVYIGVDPAVKTGPDCDDTVIFVLGLLPDKTYIIIDIIAEKIKIEDQPMRVYEAMVIYQAYAVVIECVQYQLSLYEQVKRICRERGKGFLLYPIEKRMSKTNAYMQIDGLCHVINTGLLSCISDCDMNKFKIQARAYSSGMKREHDDTLDGLALALTNNFFPPNANIEELIRKEKEAKCKKEKPKSFMAL
jgi:hypothetical protein